MFAGLITSALSGLGSILSGLAQPFMLLLGGRKMGVDAQQAADVKADNKGRDANAEVDRKISGMSNDAIRADLTNRFTKKG